MDSVEFRLPAWVHSFGRNPLVRASDRVEATVIVLAILLVLLAVPFAGALGTAVHDSRSRAYAEEAKTRHTVPATAIEDSAERAAPYTVAIAVHARWRVNGVERTGEIELDHAVKAGDPLVIWIDRDGNQVVAPTPISHARDDAIRVAIVVWQSLALAIAGLVIAVRSRLDRIRESGWDRDIRSLVDEDGGQTNRQP